MKILSTALVLVGLTVGVTGAHAQSGKIVHDYPTLAEMNPGLSQYEFSTFDLNKNGVLDPDEQVAFIDADYTNESPVELGSAN